MAVNQDSGDALQEKMLYKMLQICKREANHNHLAHPLQDFVERVSYYTEVPSNKLQEILNKKHSELMSNIKPMDCDTFIQAIKLITKFYLMNQFPTYELLFEHLVNNTGVTNIDELKEKLSVFGIENRTIMNKTFLVEDGTCAYERYTFLDKIKKLRARKAHIYYIDERIISKSLKLKKPWKSVFSTSHNSQEYILFYAISKSGYKNGLFCNHASVEEFSKWIVDILLPELEPSSVIIFDNSPLHESLKTKSVSMFDTKQDMIKYLEKHNVPYHRKLHKVQLYDLIKKFVPLEETYSLDQVIRANGYEVLRLPTNLAHLSPVHQMWEELIISLESPLLDPLLFETKDEIHAQLMNMKEDTFLEFEQSIIDCENQLMMLNRDLEVVQDKFLSCIKLSLANTQSNILLSGETTMNIDDVNKIIN